MGGINALSCLAAFSRNSQRRASDNGVHPEGSGTGTQAQRARPLKLLSSVKQRAVQTTVQVTRLSVH